MKVLKGIGNTILFIITVLVVGIALLNFFSSPDGKGLLGYKGYTVLSDSMEPTISAGDYIIVSMTPFEEIEKNDIITYQESENTLVTHRAVEKTDEGLVTRGDANDTEDVRRVQANALIGEVRWVVPYLGQVMLFMRQPLFIIALMVVLILSLLVSYYRSGKAEHIPE
ncbi:signal peptidase I [Atopococcus tabaci]|uniref:signal peptidase I n=1 Tax=Atopococcus tabaci TaxID=269774 RepID=UPI000688E6DE|nr:signal peptidase I [Atopococcus tabaci]